MILLDTNAVLWTVLDDPRLGSRAQLAIEQDEERRYSVMVLWELAMLAGKGKLGLQHPLDRWIERARAHLAMKEVSVTGIIAQDAGGLSDGIHGDPCDRIMIATARALGCPLVTSDRKILAYAAAGHLRAIDARR